MPKKRHAEEAVGTEKLWVRGGLGLKRFLGMSRVMVEAGDGSGAIDSRRLNSIVDDMAAMLSRYLRVISMMACFFDDGGALG